MKPTLIPPPSRQPAYTPFSFKEPPPNLPAKADFDRDQNREWLEWCDSLEDDALIPLILNLVASLVARGERGKDGTGTFNLVVLAGRSLSALQYLATFEQNPSKNAQKFAVNHLVTILTQAIEKLNFHANKSPVTYREVAEASIMWPILYSPHLSFGTKIKELQEVLHIGDDYFLKLKGSGDKRKRSLDFDIPSNQLVFRLIEILELNRRSRLSMTEAGTTGTDDGLPAWVKECWKLPPLRQVTVANWSSIGWMALCDAYDGHPERDCEIRKIGMSEDAKKASRSKKPEKEQIESVDRAVIRSIKNKITAGLAKLARD